MTSLFSRLQKLNKEATPGEWKVRWDDSDWPGSKDLIGVEHKDGRVLEFADDYGTNSALDAALIVECRNSLPAVLNLIEAAQRAREESQQLIGMEDPFGSQGPPILIGADAWFELAEAVAVFVSGQEEPK